MFFAVKVGLLKVERVFKTGVVVGVKRLKESDITCSLIFVPVSTQQDTILPLESVCKSIQTLGASEA